MKRLSIVLSLSLGAASPALAHINLAEHGSFAAGLSHPLFGADHVLAMVTVGLWAFVGGSRTIWTVPATFVVTMMVGFAAAIAGINLPLVEPAIAASVVVLGLLLLAALRVSVAVGATVVGFFALFHGYAHGGEIGSTKAFPFMAGFMLATATLLVTGLAIGYSSKLRHRNGEIALRAAGGLIALAGLRLVAGT